MTKTQLIQLTANMSNATNITNNSVDACPRDLQYGIPDAWRDSTSSNFSQAACAAPACDNFPSTHLLNAADAQKVIFITSIPRSAILLPVHLPIAMTLKLTKLSNAVWPTKKLETSNVTTRKSSLRQIVESNVPTQRSSFRHRVESVPNYLTTKPSTGRSSRDAVFPCQSMPLER